MKMDAGLKQIQSLGILVIVLSIVANFCVCILEQRNDAPIKIVFINCLYTL